MDGELISQWWAHELFHWLGAAALASWIFWILLSITLHELGHGWAALRQGDRTPVEVGHMTLNPLVHMGLHSLIVFGLCGIAWGQMPVNPLRFRDGRRGDALVSLAGPAMNVGLAVVCFVGLLAWLKLAPTEQRLYSWGAMFFYLGLTLNVVLILINLLPIPPLDGSRVLAAYSRRAAELLDHPQAAIIGMFAFLVIFFMSPIGDLLIGGIFVATISIVDAAGGWLGNPPLGPALVGA